MWKLPARAGTTTSSWEAGAERRRSRPCWRAPASGARRLGRVPRSAERAAAPQAGCVRQAVPPSYPTSLDQRCRPPRLLRVCARTPRAARVGRVPGGGSRLRLDMPEEKREELFFLIAKVDTFLVPEELPELPGRREPSRSIPGRGSTAQPHCLHESIVMVARERDQGGVALHSTTLIRTRRTTRRLSPPGSTSRRATARSRPATARPTCSGTVCRTPRP
jgi:hypothetical protein